MINQFRRHCSNHKPQVMTDIYDWSFPPFGNTSCVIIFHSIYINILRNIHSWVEYPITSWILVIIDYEYLSVEPICVYYNLNSQWIGVKTQRSLALLPMRQAWRIDCSQRMGQVRHLSRVLFIMRQNRLDASTLCWPWFTGADNFYICTILKGPQLLKYALYRKCTQT